jgi:3-deoxy-D-manno-octulosonic-acid transferase
MLSVIPLVEAPQFQCAGTSGTVTSARLADERLPPNVIHQFVPLDTPRYGALHRARPNLGCSPSPTCGRT